MRRLRFALDSEEMHDFYDSTTGGHKPRFARYNSDTIGGVKPQPTLGNQQLNAIRDSWNGRPGIATKIMEDTCTE